MNEITTTKSQLPDTIEELSSFVFMGREKLVALKAAIRACQKSEILSDKLSQMKEEQMLLSESVLIAETRIGELLLEVPRARNQYDAKSTAEPSKTEKQKTVSDLGISDSTAKRYQTLARHPEKVEQAIESARKEERPVTRSEVLKEISKEQESQKKTYKDIVAEAKEEHDSLQNPEVINIAAVKHDKDNVKTLADAFWVDTMDVCTRVERLGENISDNDLQVYANTTESDRKKALLQAIVSANQTLARIFNNLGGRNAER